MGTRTSYISFSDGIEQNVSSQCNLPAQIESVQGKIRLMNNNDVNERYNLIFNYDVEQK